MCTEATPAMMAVEAAGYRFRGMTFSEKTVSGDRAAQGNQAREALTAAFQR
jgi:hypothetical protein